MKHRLKKVYAPYYQSPKQFESYFKNLHLTARLRKIVYGKHWNHYLKIDYCASIFINEDEEPVFYHFKKIKSCR